jgi:hypothetical protein
MPELAPSPKSRPRGRPAGSTSRVLRRGQALGVQHFAFLRSCLLGLDQKRAWERYLASSEGGSDLGHVMRRRKALWHEVLEAGRALPPTRAVVEALALLTRAGAAAGDAPALPTLDEFIEAEGLDRDFYSEAELLQQYREHHHLDGAAALARAPRDTADDQVRALFVIESGLGRAPAADDAVETWFVPGIAAQLRRAGQGSLGAAIDAINERGYRWYRQVPKLGETRARGIVAWLATAGEAFGRPVDAAACRRPAPQPALDAGPRAGSQPSRHGNDAEGAAVAGWLQRHAAQPATLRTYEREIERFRRWLREVRGKELLAADGADCAAYPAFLAAVPEGWVCQRPVARGDTAWRPFRGSLAPSSQRLALAAVRSFFDSLAGSGANPVPAPPVAPREARRHAAADWDRLLDAARLVGDTSAAGQRLLSMLLLARAGVRPGRMVDPRIAPLRAPPPAWLRGADGSLSLQQRPMTGRLTAGGVRRAIRRFRARCGELAESFQGRTDGNPAAWPNSVKATGGC